MIKFTAVVSSDPCAETTTVRVTGTFFSPNYQADGTGQYARDSDCDWLITATYPEVTLLVLNLAILLHFSV